MLDIEEKMIVLLKNGVTFTKLKSKTGLCSSELAKKINRLKNKGHIINKQFNQDVVKLMIDNDLIDELKDNVKIDFDNRFSFLVLSDTHIGNIYENISLIKSLYKYAEKRNIKYVFHLGDLTEGTAIKDSKNIRIKRFTVDDQVSFLTRNYPKHDSINTLYILGNHDERWVKEGIDISKIIDSRRYDMHCLGYKNSKITIGNTNILMQHPFSIEREQKYDDEIRDLYICPNFDLVLRGHTHYNGIYINDMNSIVVNVPACYGSPTRKYIGAYEIILKKNEEELKQLIVDEDVQAFAHLKFPLENKTYNNEKIDQTTKFNKRLEKTKSKFKN